MEWIITALVSAVCIRAVLAACTRHDDKRQIRAWIDAGAALAEAHHISGMLKPAIENVRALPMDLGRQAIKLLRRTFGYCGLLIIFYPRPAVEIMDDTNEASVRLPFLITTKAQTIPNRHRLCDDPVAWIEAIVKTADL